MKPPLPLIVLLVFFLNWIPTAYAGVRLSSDEIWDKIAQAAPDYNLDPKFVWGLILAEEGLHANFKQRLNKGPMKISMQEWKAVTHEPYQNAYNWKENLHKGMEYLSKWKDVLHQQDQFSYPLLSAVYKYGPERVNRYNNNLKKLPKPKNRVYQKLFKGDLEAIQPPV